MLRCCFIHFLSGLIREEKLNLLQPIVDQLPSYEEKRTELEKRMAEVFFSVSFCISTVYSLIIADFTG